jgi:glucose/arabinose dehydrogenase
MPAKLVLGLLVLALACGAAAPPLAVAIPGLPGGFQDEIVFSGLEEPTTLGLANDGRVFVAEKTGRIKVFDALGDPTPTLFADLRTYVYDSGDRGLLGLALDPDFPAEPYVYALYTYDHMLGEAGGAPKWGEPDDSGDVCPLPEGADVNECPVSGRLVRLTAEGGGDQAVEEDGEVRQEELVEGWCQQFSSHSVGDLEFGPDGALYASGGEGASFYAIDYGQFGWPQKNQCGDPPGLPGTALSPPSAEGGALRSQDARTLADPTGLSGSVIRIDPDTGLGLPSNPMFSSFDANARRILAYGFRNPFRFAIDPDDGRLYVGNVGWGSYEEIDRLPAAPSEPLNSGWPCYEGRSENPGYESAGLGLCEGLYAEPDAAASPFFLYRRSGTVVPGDPCSAEAGSALSGLVVYPGGPYPATYDGALFFADSVRGCIYAMLPDEDGHPDPLNVTPFLSDGGIYPGIDLEVGPDGRLYYVRLFGDDFEDGEIHRISFEPDAPIARLSASPEWGAADPLEVELDATGSSDPNGDPLTYEWDLDGDGTFETSGGSQRSELFGGDENVTVAVRVSDGLHVGSDRVTIYPGDTPPQPVIDQPEADFEWRVGEEVEFSGYAEDAEEDLGSARLHWKTRLYHCPGTASACHAHPLQIFPGVGGGSFAAPDHDYPAYLEISLSATDSRGLSATESVTIDPRTVDLTIESDPGGLELTAGVRSAPAPFSFRAIEGSSLVLSAPATAHLNGREHTWSNWSDDGARVHAIVAEKSRTYRASYTDVGDDSDADSGATGGAGERLRVILIRHPPRRTRRHLARFSFGATQASALFRCRLDSGPFAPCRSPRLYRNLESGRHVFRVFAQEPDRGMRSPAAVFSWRILCPADARAGLSRGVTRRRPGCAR